MQQGSGVPIFRPVFGQLPAAQQAAMAAMLAPSAQRAPVGPPINPNYVKGQVDQGFYGPTRRYFDENALLQAGMAAATAAQRFWQNPGSAMSRHTYNVVGTDPQNVYGGPRSESRNPSALSQLSWEELSNWGPVIPPRGSNAREAVAFMELSVSADDNIGGDNTFGFSGNPGTFGISYFPVVYRFTAAGSITQGSNGNVRDIKVLPFAVVASSEPWAGTYFGLRPQYVTLGQPESRVQLMLDINFCKNDTNLVLSTLASALSFLPGRWAGGAGYGGAAPVTCYLTIAPALSMSAAQTFHADACNFMGENPSEVNIRQSMAFGGASLGLAVAAAICGLPPMLYTGYLSSMGMDHVFYGQKTSRDALRAGIPIEALSKVILGATFVESVDDVPFKVDYAINAGMPIVIPLNPTWTHASRVEGLSAYRAAVKAALNNGQLAQRQESIMRKALISAGIPMDQLAAASKANFANVMADYIMTVTKLAGGKSFLEVGSLVMAASNYADARMLACKYAGYCYGGYNTDTNAGRARAAQTAGTLALQMEAKGLLQTAVQREINTNKAAQRKAAKAEGRPIPKPKPKKQAENTWMEQRKLQQKEKAREAQRLESELRKSPVVKEFLAAQRASLRANTAAGNQGAAAAASKAAVTGFGSGKYKVRGKAAGKAAGKAGGKIKADAAGLMRASKASRMQFLAPMQEQGFQFVNATTELPTLQQIRFAKMAAAHRAQLARDLQMDTSVSPRQPFVASPSDMAPAAMSAAPAASIGPTKRLARTRGENIMVAPRDVRGSGFAVDATLDREARLAAARAKQLELQEAAAEAADRAMSAVPTMWPSSAQFDDDDN